MTAVATESGASWVADAALLAPLSGGAHESVRNRNDIREANMGTLERWANIT
jgi:hypothetical protein